MDDKINLGGGYGDCSIQLAHYGILRISLWRCDHQQGYSAADLVQMVSRVANSHTAIAGQKNVKIVDCTVDFNARTGIALTGGDKIDVTNTSITNTGRCVFASTGTGVDIEAQVDSQKKAKLVTNVKFYNCNFRNNSSGEILAKVSAWAPPTSLSRIATSISASRAVNVGRKNVGYKFINNRIGGS
jgi:hypothetical protein